MVASRFFPAAIAVLLAAMALPGVFVFDDHSLFQSPAIAGSGAWRLWFDPAQTRPLSIASFWLDHVLWDRNSAGFHFTNLLIHLANAALVFACARRLVPPSTAGFAAAVFALHPLAHQPLFYVFARSGSLAALFCLSSFLLWLNGRRWWSVAVFAAALLAKEEWVAFPIVLLLCSRARREPVDWKPLSSMLALAVMAGIRVLYATKTVAGAGSGFGQSASPWEYFILQGQAIPSYLWRVVLPIGFSIDPPPPQGGLEAGLLGWIVLIAVSAVLLWRGLDMQRPGFWIVTSLILLLPSSSFLPAADAIAYRRMYLPMVSIAVAISLLTPLRWRIPVGLLLSGLALWQASSWRSEKQIWLQAQERGPGLTRPKIHLARLSPPAEALRYLEAAKSLSPDDPAIASEMGRVHLENRDAAAALSEFGRALALAPNDPANIQNRGVALLLLGQTDVAKLELERALQRDPCLGPARENLQKLGVTLPPSSVPCPAIGRAGR